MNEYEFDPRTLDPGKRRNGISAFMRIKNGAAFLERAIESHIGYFDEVVAVYNDCVDSTPDILERLAGKYPGTLRVFEYRPSVYPPGSKGHSLTPSDSVHSLANYYNYALSKTACKIVTKLDDDHLAIQRNLKKAVDSIRKKGLRKTALCYSGINLVKSPDGRLGVFCNLPFAGNKDCFFFPVSEETFFSQAPRYEVLHTPGYKKRYAGILFFHLKFLKSNYGLDNYNLAENPDSRLVRMRDFIRDHSEPMSLGEFLSLDTHYYLYPDAPDFLQPVRPGKYRITRKIDRVVPMLALLSRVLPGDIFLARACRLREDMKDISIPADLLM